VKEGGVGEEGGGRVGEGGGGKCGGEGRGERRGEGKGGGERRSREEGRERSKRGWRERFTTSSSRGRNMRMNKHKQEEAADQEEDVCLVKLPCCVHSAVAQRYPKATSR